MDSETIEIKKNEVYGYKTYNIIAYITGFVLLPLLGLIMGIVAVKQRKKHAWSIIIVSIVGWVLNFFLSSKL
ncbi:hypothetical protein ACIQXI_03340 [Lysinibacillus sp. NPDC097195]|uniref:hypothetical protein n=1 Tax=Lysinibacillus sp. NPDC097195 TaxID=3364141 RepID=UPI0037FCFADF